MELHVVAVEKPEDMNVIVGQAHFIKTVEDIHEALAGVSPHLRFGVAFCEASGPCLVRRSGNDDRLVELAARNALGGRRGPFVLRVRRGRLPGERSQRARNRSRRCAASSAPPPTPSRSSSPTPTSGRGIAGVIDGRGPIGVESDADVVDRKALLRTIGYKL